MLGAAWAWALVLASILILQTATFGTTSNPIFIPEAQAEITIFFLPSNQYGPGDTATIEVWDSSADRDPDRREAISVSVSSTADIGGIDVLLTETGPHTGIFEGEVFLTPVDESGGHRLRVSPGDTITVSYQGVTATAQITPIQDFSPRTVMCGSAPCEVFVFPSISGDMPALAAASDGLRLYAGGKGVWRSDDGSLTWRQMTRPQPSPGQNEVPGALGLGWVFDIAVSPTNRDLVLVTTHRDPRIDPKDGIYRSTDGGSTWSLVHQFTCPNLPGDPEPVGEIVFAPDDPNLVYAAGGCALGISRDAGLTWTETEIAGVIWHVAVAPKELENGPDFRRVYGVGEEDAQGFDYIWYSEDGGLHFVADEGRATICYNISSSSTSCGYRAFGDNYQRKVLAVEPGQPDHLYLAAQRGADGPLYGFSEVEDGAPCTALGWQCREGSLWLGDFSNFSTNGAAEWTQMPGPPVQGSAPSGFVYVMAKPIPGEGGYLLFFSDRSHVHVSVGRPTVNEWHRLDGSDVSTSWQQGYISQFVHVDPRGRLATSPDFHITLTDPVGVPALHNRNKVLDQHLGGTIWMANDGGVYYSTDGGSTWWSGAGLSTLSTWGLVGLSKPGSPPAFYFSTIYDNGAFYSLDGGQSWNPAWLCGDCLPYYVDPAQPSRVLKLYERDGAFILIKSDNPEQYPDPNTPASRQLIPCPPTDPSLPMGGCTGGATGGYEPIIQTLPDEEPLPDGDYVVLKEMLDGVTVLRTTNISQILEPEDWDDPNKAVQQGSVLPGCDAPSPFSCIPVVQASGGHERPVFYLGEVGYSMRLWKWTEGMEEWLQIVPSDPQVPLDRSAQMAKGFFVNPYNPDEIYIIDENAIKRSDDGGLTWQRDPSLDSLVTENGSFPYDGNGDLGRSPWMQFVKFAVINDIIFDRREPGTKFALGNAGVFYTLDGRNWSRLLSTTALPSDPLSAYFDPISDPNNRCLYVATVGRGILQNCQIPAPTPRAGIDFTWVPGTFRIIGGELGQDQTVIPTVGERFRVAQKVTNTGNLNAGEYCTQLIIIHPDGREEQGAYNCPGGLGAAQKFEMAHFFTINEPGTYQMKLVADFRNQVKETDETNNVSVHTISVGVPSQAAHFIQPTISFDKSSYLPDEMMSIEILDPNANRNHGMTDKIGNVQIIGQNTGKFTYFIVPESGPNTDIFERELGVAKFWAPTPPDKIIATYTYDYGGGNSGSITAETRVVSSIQVPAGPLTVKTDKATYLTAGEIVVVGGTVPEVVEGVPVAIQVFRPDGVIYAISQILPGADGRFSTSFEIGGILAVSGVYTVKTIYSGQSVETTFEFVGGVVRGEPEPVLTERALEIFTEDSYITGGLVTVSVRISGVDMPLSLASRSVALMVTDPSGIGIISRTLTADEFGSGEFQFRLSDNSPEGTYTVTATVSVDGITLTDSTTFEVLASPVTGFGSVTIVSVQTTDQQGNPVSSFSRGSTGFVKVVVMANVKVEALATVSLFGSDLTALGLASIKTNLSVGQSEMLLSFFVPAEASVGTANIYANALSDWPALGGTPLTGEESASMSVE